MKKSYLIIITICTALILSSITLVFAWLQQASNNEENKTIGLVDVDINIYFEKDVDGVLIHEPLILEVQSENVEEHIDAINKMKVYKVIVDNKNSIYSIDNLRVSFSINSTVKTYFRIRVIDTLTITRTLNNGNKVEQALSNDPINYNIASSNKWFYDYNTSWIYYSDEVSKSNNEDVVIPYITSGLNYDLKPVGQYIQFAVQVESTQSIRGVKENWGLDVLPWLREGEE